MVLLPETGAQGAAHVAQNILERAVGPYDIDGHQLSISSSIGISLYPHDGTDVETLIKNADTAMYHAKENGAATYQFFTREMNVAVFERLTVENGLRHALDHAQFVLYYQPQIDIKTGRTIGAEALIRWRHPQLGILPAARFIEVAEETGLIVAIGEWVLHEACRQNREWQLEGLPAIPVAVNLSARQLRKHIAQTVVRVLEDTGLEANWLDLELTEHVMMQDAEATLTTLGSLQEHGRQALDRRLRHRLLQPRVSEAAAHRPGQDRPLLHPRHHRGPGRSGHRQRHHRHGPHPALEGGCRRRGDPAAARLSARGRLRRSPGLPVRPPHAGGRSSPSFLRQERVAAAAR